jgi:hypothetical protein
MSYQALNADDAEGGEEKRGRINHQGAKDTKDTKDTKKCSAFPVLLVSLVYLVVNDVLEFPLTII